MYHRHARTESYRWWKPIAELVLFVLLVFALWLGAIPLLYEAVGPAEDGAPGIIKLGLTIACATPAAIVAARIVGRRWGALCSVENRFRWRWFATCTGVAIGSVVLSTIVSIALEQLGQPLGPPRGAWVGWDSFLPLAITVVIVIPLQASAEELAFRGTFLQAIGAWVPWPWVSIAITSLVFGLAHDLPLEGFVAITTFGIVAAWLTIRTGGLEAAIALHVLNNVSLFLFDAATGRGDKWVSELNEDIGWLATGVDVTMNLLYGFVVAKLYVRASGASAR